MGGIHLHWNDRAHKCLVISSGWTTCLNFHYKSMLSDFRCFGSISDIFCVFYKCVCINIFVASVL